MYRAPHTRHNENIISRKGHPKKYNKPIEEPTIKFKKKHKHVNNGYKMSYRYKYYKNESIVEEDEKTEESEEIDS